MYNGTVTSVRAIGEDIGCISEYSRFIPWFVLSPYLFVLVMDEQMRHVEDEILWCMLFTDNII